MQLWGNARDYDTISSQQKIMKLNSLLLQTQQNISLFDVSVLLQNRSNQIQNE